MTDVLRVANCAGFHGDRPSAARIMVEGGPIDVLTGDGLAGLSLLDLARQRDRGGSAYVRTFLAQVEQVLGTCLERGIKIVSNAGGLEPAGCAAAIQELAARLGLSATVAYVTGDDLLPRLGELGDLPNVHTGERLVDVGVEPVSANAYLGGGPIAEALNRGADVVVAGSVADATLVVGAGRWRFGWSPEDGPEALDALAGTAVAGHVVGGGCLAELSADGSAIITKHPGTDGHVTIGTVTAQLLYEIAGSRYPTPDAVARLDTARLDQERPGRVRVYGTRGEQPPPELEVAITYADDESSHGGYWPATVPVDTVPQGVVIRGEEISVPHARPGAWQARWALPESIRQRSSETDAAEPEPGDRRTVSGPTQRAPLGRIVAARSGHKGGDANVAVWAGDTAAYDWLETFLTVQRFQELLPEAAELPVEQHRLPNLFALNFVVRGLLGRRGTAGTHSDPQAGALGERLQACLVDVPESLLSGLDADGWPAR